MKDLTSLIGRVLVLGVMLAGSPRIARGAEMNSNAAKDAKMTTAPVIAANAVRVRMAEPVLVDQASPTVKDWGPYRMPKIYRLPTGESCVTFAIGADHYRDQGMTSPAFISHDNGASWKKSVFPSRAIKGMGPVIFPVLNGEYLCIPAGRGLELDSPRMPKPIATFGGYAGYPVIRLRDCPEDVIRWFKDINGVRWSPTTNQWAEEKINWFHEGQLVWYYNDTPQHIGGDWSQRVYFEGPVVCSSNELLYADCWTSYESASGKPPPEWECSLMVSGDNGHSWTRRSTLVTGSAQDQTTEPIIEMNQEGELVGVLRGDMGVAKPMYLVHSTDRGYTWSKPQLLFEFGVFPRLLQLANGVLVLSYGRPGVWLSFSLDGGHSWTQPQALITGDRADCQKHSCGYTSLLAVSPDTFLIAYGNFLLPNAKGEPCKSILVQTITVTQEK